MKTFSSQQQQQQRETIQRQRENLPIYASKEELVSHIAQNETVVILGETGSGKTTQIPQFVYERMVTTTNKNNYKSSSATTSFIEKGTMVAVTQPRRVAAVSVAKRVSQEIGARGKLGDLVGYGIRFDDCSSEQTRIKFFTDGMLLREALNDPLLSRYGAILVDEAHERTLQTDFLLGTLKAIQEKRRTNDTTSTNNNVENRDDDDNNNRKKRKKKPPPPPLKQIIMSAPLDASSFSDFFEGCSIIYIKGRTFPVETFYLKEPEEDYIDATLCSVMQINEDEKDTKGDVLVFLTGQEEIESLGKLLMQRGKDTHPQLNVVLLFAAMPPE